MENPFLPRGAWRKKHGRSFHLQPPRSKTIEIAEPLTAIYFRPPQYLAALHSRSILNGSKATPSAFLTPSSAYELRLFSKPTSSTRRGSPNPLCPVLDTHRHEPARRVAANDTLAQNEFIGGRGEIDSEIVLETSS